MKYTRFEEFPIWKDAMRICRTIYGFTSVPPFSRDFGLKDQIQRASVSIGSNIAEGFERNNNNEFIRFLGYAKASTGEARTQLYLAIDLKYVETKVGNEAMKRMTDLNNELGGFISYLKKSRRQKNSLIRNSQFANSLIR